MGTIANKLNLLMSTKAAIRAALIEKGQTVADGDPFSSYADKIAAIEAGVALPTLTNPGVAADLAAGKQLIGADGSVITGTMGAVGFNRKCTTVKTTINAAGTVYFGDYYDLMAAADSFTQCVAEVYDAAGSYIQAALTLNLDSVSGDNPLFSGTCINSSLAIDFLRETSSLGYFTRNSFWWVLDPGCLLTGRKVRLTVYDVL